MSFANNKGIPDVGMMIAKMVFEIGNVLVSDDIHDYGKFDHLHHWFIGEVFRQAGRNLGGALVGLSILGDMQAKNKVFPLTTDDEAKLERIIEDCKKMI